MCEKFGDFKVPSAKIKMEGRRRKFIEALLNIRNPILTKDEAGY